MHKPHVLQFHLSIGRQKPNNLRNPNGSSCPFCRTDELEQILATEEDTIWLMNKFPTLSDTWQTVIVESDECDGDIATYSPEKWQRIFTFAVKHWLDVANSGKFASVTLCKNHGPMSGGSLRHPHMQIVGFTELDYMKKVERYHIEGLVVAERDGVQWNISAEPMMGFAEFNIIGTPSSLPTMATFIQQTVQYVTTKYHNGSCQSYNLFFYQFGAEIACKVVPRYVVSPYYVGYQIAQVVDTIDDIRTALQHDYC